MSKPTSVELRARSLLRDLEDARQDLQHYVVLRNRLSLSLVLLIGLIAYLGAADPLGGATGVVGIPATIALLGSFVWLLTHICTAYLREMKDGKTMVVGRNEHRERVRYCERALDDFNFENGVGL